jgi:membrane fusion protein, heavy metal efflux system
MKPVQSIFPIVFFLSQALLAQEVFEVSSEEIALMGLEFGPVTTVDRQLGVQLPAHVISAPDNETELISRFSGVVDSWVKQAGETVMAGEVIAVIRSLDLIAEQQTYLEHWSELQLADQKFSRDQMLLEQGIIAESRLQQSEQTLNGARSQLRASENLLTMAGLGEQDLTDLRNGRAELGLAFLRAPVEGVLARRMFRVGDSIAANVAIARLSQSGNGWVAIQVPARLLGLFGENSQLSTPDGDWGLTLRARDFVINPATQSAEVLAQFTAETPLLLGQMLNVVIHPSPSAMMVPSEAVVHERGQTLVYVFSSGVIQMRALQLVPVGDGYVTQADLSLGDQLVTKGAALVKGMQLGLGQ